MTRMLFMPIRLPLTPPSPHRGGGKGEGHSMHSSERSIHEGNGGC